MFQEQPNPESRRETQASIDRKVARALEIGIKFTRKMNKLEREPDAQIESARKLTPAILSPVQLEILFNLGAQHFEPLAGVYLSTLVEKSYDAGYNEFTFNSNCSDYFLSYISASSKNPLKVTLQGTYGAYMLLESSNIEIINEGTIGKNCAEHADTIHLINKGTLVSYAHNAKRTHIENYGTIKDMTTLINQATLATVHENEYATWCKQNGRTNTVELIDANGKVLDSNKPKPNTE